MTRIQQVQLPTFSHSLYLPMYSAMPPVWHLGLLLLRCYIEMLLPFLNVLFPRGKNLCIHLVQQITAFL